MRDDAAARPVHARDAGPAVTLAPGAATTIQAAVDRFSGGAAIVIADGRSGRILHAVAPDERVLARLVLPTLLRWPGSPAR